MTAFAPNATVIFAHGAWADGSCWQKVITPLEKGGLGVICAPLPLTSLSDEIVALERVIERTKGPVLLAGHAYGGAPIAGPKDSRVRSLVYLAALAHEAVQRPIAVEMRSRKGSRARLENEAIVVSGSRTGSNDCAQDAALHGGADACHDSRTRRGSQSNVYGTRPSPRKASRMGSKSTASCLAP